MNIAEQIESLPQDPYEKVIAVAKGVFGMLVESPLGDVQLGGGSSFRDLIKQYALLQALIESLPVTNDIQKLERPKAVVESKTGLISIHSYAISAHNTAISLMNELYLSECLEDAKHLLAKSSYSFSADELLSIQNQINILRAQITECGPLSSDHKYRLLSKLEKLQLELHKSMSNLDRFGGFIVEAGIVLGRFGTEVKPLVDRVRELADTIWKAQSPTKSLPESTANLMLPTGEKGLSE